VAHPGPGGGRTTKAEGKVTTDGVPQLLDLRSVAAVLCCSPHTVRKFIRQSKLRPVRLCRKLLFESAEIARFIAEAQRR
jgi:hypothetical protein